MKIGDKVVVVNKGRTYTSYSDMMKIMGFKDANGCDIPENRSEAVIFAVAVHPWQKINIYGIQNDLGEQFLIGESGVELQP